MPTEQKRQKWGRRKAKERDICERGKYIPFSRGALKAKKGQKRRGGESSKKVPKEGGGTSIRRGGSGEDCWLPAG
jgi:hypothetical protein